MRGWWAWEAWLCFGGDWKPPEAEACRDVTHLPGHGPKHVQVGAAEPGACQAGERRRRDRVQRIRQTGSEDPGRR